MVQVIEPTRIGSQLGEALQRGTAAGSELGMQRGMLAKGLEGLSKLQPGQATSIDLAKELIQATQGIPGAERYVGQLFSMLSPQFQAKGIPEGEATAVSKGPFESGKGYLSSAPLTQPQKMEAAKELTKQGIPLDQGIDLVNKISGGSEQALAHIQSMLASQGVTDREMPYATQMAQLLSEREGIADPNELIKRVRSSLDEFRQVDGILTPGIGKALVKTGLPFGLVGSLLAGGESRDKMISRLDPMIRKLSEKGFDPILREKLASQGLSPTEVQESMYRANHPVDFKKFENSISKFPSPSKNDKINQDRLQDLVFKSVEDGVPLLSIRHKLWKDKGYDWRQVVDAFNADLEKGMRLNRDQDRELAEFTSQPPRESLVDIFSDWGRPFDVLLKRK